MAIECDLVERALHLSAGDRTELVQRLIVRREADNMENDVENAWAAEIERRLAGYERAETAAVAWCDAVERARKAIGKSRGPMRGTGSNRQEELL